MGHGQTIYTWYHQRFLYRSQTKTNRTSCRVKSQNRLALETTLCINHEETDEIQNKIDFKRECSVKGAMVQSRTKFIENEEAPLKLFYAGESVFLKKQNHNTLKS